MTWTVRDAVPDDAAALVRMRVVMLEALDADVSDLGWVPGAVEHVTEQLGSGAMVAVVAEEGAAVVSGGMARVWRQLPGPGDDGSRAWVFNVATEAGHRRRGIGRDVVTRLVERLDALGVHRVDLTASEDGLGLYESLGFERAPYPLLRRKRRA